MAFEMSQLGFFDWYSVEKIRSVTQRGFHACLSHTVFSVQVLAVLCHYPRKVQQKALAGLNSYCKGHGEAVTQVQNRIKPILLN